MALAVVAGVILLLSDPSPSVDGLGFAPEVLKGEVVETEEGPCSFAADLECRRVAFRLQEGPDVGAVVTEKWELLPSASTFEEGDAVVPNRVPDAPLDVRYQGADRERRPLLLVASLFFVIIVALLGRGRGLAALLGLALSVIYIVPSVLSGNPAEFVALSGGGLIALIAPYLAHGVTSRPQVATSGPLRASR